MKAYADWMAQLIEAFIKFPGIGRRSAERIVFYLLKTKREEVSRLATLLGKVRDTVFFCDICHNFSDAKICHICSDPARDQGVICVVEDPKDVIAIDKTQEYVGVYHVLLGALSALDGIGPAEIQIQGLLTRVKTGKVREVIIATNSNTEGETTSLYLAKVLKPLGVKITRIARGIPVGSHIEFMDQATLSRALEDRVAT
ncbi:MAG: recombination mediator RecR [Candidatus Omnitrophota bacterium]|nr:recombination mediator RecR [Candidatus Omnitrophota bacterium]